MGAGGGAAAAASSAAVGGSAALSQMEPSRIKHDQACGAVLALAGIDLQQCWVTYAPDSSSKKLKYALHHAQGANPDDFSVRYHPDTKKIEPGMRVFIRQDEGKVPVAAHWRMIPDKKLWPDDMPKPDNYVKFIAGRGEDLRFKITRQKAAPGLPDGWKEATWVGSAEALERSYACSPLQSVPRSAPAPRAGSPSPP